MPDTIVYASPVAPLAGYRLSGTGVNISLLLDTGAAVTLLREDTWLQVAAKDTPALKPWSAAKLISAAGAPLTVHGSASIELKLGNEGFITEVLVVSPLTSEAILGLDFLMEHQASIDLPSRTLHLKERGCNIPLQDPTMLHKATSELTVRAIRTVEVPPCSTLQVTGDIGKGVEGAWLVEEALGKNLPLAVARALVEPKSKTVPLCVLNMSGDPVTVYAGMVLATLQAVDTPTLEVGAVTKDKPREVEAEKQEILWDLVQNSGVDLSSGEKELFYELLLSYADVLACSAADLGKMDPLKHHIDTGNAAPIRQPVRRVLPHRHEKVRQLLDQMLQRGVIEPSASPWASPVVLVQKKDGSMRFCVDYRKVNKVTRKDAYPLPRIDATLDTLHGSQWFSTLDLLSGYWQVEVAEPDQPKTAFCTAEGLFQFRVMPFGLSNAPATFQRLYCIQHMQARQKRLVVHFDRLKPCSPDIRLPMSTGSKRGVTASSSATLPVGTDLELLEDPHEDLPRDIPAPGGVSSSAHSPTQPNVSEGGSVPLVSTSVSPPPQSFRYPRRARSQPDRYRPESSS